MPCGGPKKVQVGNDQEKSPSTSSIVQMIFSFWSIEISEDILRNQKFRIGFDSFSNQRYIFGYVWIILVFVLTRE